MSIDRHFPETDLTFPTTVIERLSRIQATLSNHFRIDNLSNRKWHIKYGGFVVAAIGFVLTRITVLPFLHLDVSLGQFIIGQVVPLVLGLGIIVLGISLALSTLPRSYVNTIAAWCLLATVGMGIVAGVVVLQVSLYTGIPSAGSVWMSSLLGNTLIAGALGGILIGIRSAENRQHRHERARHSNRLTLLNRLLRHEVLNEVTIIHGYTAHLATDGVKTDDDALQVIDQSADRIETIVEDVGFLTRLRSRDDPSAGSIAMTEVIEEQVRTARKQYPDAVFTIEEPSAVSDDIHVRADSHLHTVFEEVLENAVQHNDSSPPRITVRVRPRNTHVGIRVADNGPGLPDNQRDILQHGDLPAHDDPSTGFGLPLVRMLVSQYGGTITVEEEQTAASGTAIDISLPRAANGDQRDLSSQVQASITPRQVGSAILAALIAGGLMGAVLQAFSGVLPAIGGLYGVRSLGVGWVLHLFHSAIFGVLFAAVLSRSRLSQSATTTGRYTAVGLGYGFVLWVVAAGIVMPLWLNAMGISAPVPYLTLPSFVGHIAWGASTGGLYGYLTR